MTLNLPLISRRGANLSLLFLFLFLPVFSFANSLSNSGDCCNDYDYWIKFPKDAVANCTYPNADDIDIGEGHCDLLAISKVDKKFYVPGSSKCYKIFRTYSVVNWCEYVDGSEPVVVSRDEDCDGKPGDEDIYVSVKTRYGSDPCEYDHYGYYSHSYHYQHVCYDVDLDPHNNYPEAGTKGKRCEYESNPKGFWKEVTDIHDDGKNFRDHCEIASVGYWQYTQMIKVSDYDAPVIDFSHTEPFCSYSSDKDNGCPAQVNLSFSVHEDCAPEDVTVRAYFDEHADGSIDEDVTHLLSGSYPYFDLHGSFPLGTHYIKVKADDGCGNVGYGKIPFEVTDCKGPSPICINGLSTRLMPVIPAADADGDGDTDDGAMEVWANDFIASPSYDCSGPVHYSINRVGESVDKYQTGLTLTCDDDQVTLVEIHAWDALANNDYCRTFIEVQRHENLCPDNGGGHIDDEEEEVVEEEEEGEESYGYGMIAGRIATEYEMPVSGVMVHRMGTEELHQVSDVFGDYAFENSSMGESYTIQPEANGDWNRGVSISDLHLLKKYLLGLAELDSPYKLLAADLDMSGSITQDDLDLMWTLFLRQKIELEFSNSWQFIPKDHVFTDPTNPWLDAIPQSIVLEEMAASSSDLNFVAIKMGDLDESVTPSGDARSANGRFAFQLSDSQVAAGASYQIDVTANDLAKIQAYQATLEFDPTQLEVVQMIDGAMSTANFGLQDVREGLVHSAWHRAVGSNQKIGFDEVLFSIEVRAKTDLNIKEAVTINTRGLQPLAVGGTDELLDIQLEFQTVSRTIGSFSVAQNTPNPFRTQTQINYHLPMASEVNLRITDVSGRLLEELRTEGVAGDNTLQLDKRSWSAGVLFYTLTAGEHSVTKKMLLVD